MPTTRTLRRAGNAVLAALLLAGSVYALSNRAGAASSLPADKMTVTASKTSVSAPNTDAVLMTAKMKTSTPADLLLQVTAECTILSSITNTGSEMQAYTAKVDLWIEVDGKPVPVVPNVTTTGASGGSGGVDDGRVVFCNREF